MERSPEEVERLKKVATRGLALAAAGLAYRYHKPIGEKIESAEIWEKTETLVMDLIESGKSKSSRLIAELARNGTAFAIKKIHLVNDDGSEEKILHFENSFDLDGKSTDNTLQSGEDTL